LRANNEDANCEQITNPQFKIANNSQQSIKIENHKPLKNPIRAKGQREAISWSKNKLPKTGDKENDATNAFESLV